MRNAYTPKDPVRRSSQSYYLRDQTYYDLTYIAELSGMSLSIVAQEALDLVIDEMIEAHENMVGESDRRNARKVVEAIREERQATLAEQAERRRGRKNAAL